MVADVDANREHIFAHPFGGSQGPCLVQLRDGDSPLRELRLGAVESGLRRADG